MKVIPRKKKIPMNKHELRIINIDPNATWEFLCENLIEHTADFFDLTKIPCLKSGESGN